MTQQWYELLFENYARTYDQESFTSGTKGECDFIEKELNYNKFIKIIDVGCGTGRHTIELTRKGYSVVGVDLSDAQLSRAREKAAKENLQIDFQKHNARHLPFNGVFDAGIMLCEGGFPLMETDEMNFEILRSVTKSLKPTAKFIFTTLNGLFPLSQSFNDIYDVPDKGSTTDRQAHSFDIITLRNHSMLTFQDDDGNTRSIECNERYYMPSEIIWLLNSLGYKKVDIFGAKLGAFSREEKLTTSHFEMLVIAEK